MSAYQHAHTRPTIRSGVCMTEVVLDFETASATDIKKSGGWKYAECPTTEILCLDYQVDDGKVMNLSAFDLPGLALAAHLRMLAADPDVLFVAHGAQFEKAIWRHLMVPYYGFSDIPNERWRDTQAVCAYKALPLGLDWAAKVTRIPYQKDTVASKFTIGLSKPNKQGYYDRSSESLAIAYKYCADDVRAQKALHDKIGELSSYELEVWLLDQKINERGVKLNLPYVRACQKIVDDATKPMLAEFIELTGIVKVKSPKLKVWCHERGVKLDNLQKETLATLLGKPEEDEVSEIEIEADRQVRNMFELPQDVRRALEIRMSLGSASVKKLGAIQCQTMSDSRVRGLVQYHGAGPSRWTGRLFQPHNIPRGTLKVGEFAPSPHLVTSAILTGDADYVGAMFGDPIEAVVSGLRHAIVAEDGHLLAAGDYASIEARTVLALAGQHDKCSLLASGADVYIDMAEAIFRRPIDKKLDPHERTIGKFSVLGCGFQMGWATFQDKYARDRDDEFCKQVIDAYRNEFAPRVPELWKGLEEASTRAVWDRKTVESHGVTYYHEDMWLVARLPSGGKMYYPNPTPTKKAMPWDKTDIRCAWQCQAWKQGRWITRDMYGGLCTQNVVEHLARDIMVRGMQNCEAAGFPVIMTVHDEIVTEPLTENANADRLRELMLNIPQWAIDLGIPVDAECWIGEEYKK